MLCVATNSLDSLRNIGKWITEIRGVESDAPIVLVITKKDLRDGQPNTAIPYNEIKRAKEDHRLIKFFETSAKQSHDYNVHKCFVKAIKLVAIDDD